MKYFAKDVVLTSCIAGHGGFAGGRALHGSFGKGSKESLELGVPGSEMGLESKVGSETEVDSESGVGSEVSDIEMVRVRQLICGLCFSSYRRPRIIS